MAGCYGDNSYDRHSERLLDEYLNAQENEDNEEEEEDNK